MRTQVMHDCTATTPWLEFYPPHSSRPERKLLDKFPFVIGRVESTSLQVLSSRVSREHAAILNDDGGFSVRDLGSTNGTFVNGTRIQESPLRDGDLITIADVEITIHLATSQAAQHCATQVIEHAQTETRGDTPDLVLEVRRYREMLLHRAQRVTFERILDLDTDEVFGVEAKSRDDGNAAAARVSRLLQATECRLIERLQQQYRLLSAEQAAQIDSPLHVFFRLQTFEIGADGLADSLCRLREVLGPTHTLVAEIPDSAVCDIPFFRTFLDQLRGLDIRTAHDGFHGSESQLLDKREIAPDFIKLSPSMVQGITRSSGGQRQIRSIIDAADDLDCAVIAVGVGSEEEAETFRELKCRYVQGECGGRVPAVGFLRSSNPVVH